MELADRIKYIMKEQGINQRELGDAISITQSAVSFILSGKNTPSEQTLRLIAETYGYNIEWLKTGEGYPRAQKTRKQQIMDLTAKMLQAEEESFISRVGAALSELTPDEWEVFENFCKKLLKDRPKEGE